MKTTAQIRQDFLRFYETKGHKIVESSTLVPQNDPTLLFTNAGMNQFKDVFLGGDKRPYSRATTAQRCVRAGGKHNDLENVGYTARHHTFFEMLGNFSFGDYFKHDAIQFAWEFLTSSQWLALPVEKLWVTVYEQDDEAYNIWKDVVGVEESHIIRIGDNKGAPYASDNFWQMGDTGPCGPCTEIFYDHGDHIWGGVPGSAEEDGDRYIEIWNIVFMQFNRLADGTMERLPKPSVDTGMGLERIAAVMQHVNSNYDIDIFQTLIKAVAKLTNTEDLSNKSLRVVADHIRSCAYLIADGVVPSNEGRGYVLRRIIRRAVRHGNLLGATSPFFYQLVPTLADVMAEAGEIIKANQAQIENLLKREEEQFSRTLDRGLSLLDEALKDVKDNTLSGEVAFKLYDTYGFPLDLTADVCRERNIQIDEAGFEKAMAEQRQRAQSANSFAMDYNNLIRTDSATHFQGYACSENRGNITHLFVGGAEVNEIHAGDKAVIILDQTPFYAESGGQVGDHGEIFAEGVRFNVVDTQKFGQAFGHMGELVEGSLKVGDSVETIVDDSRRQASRLNHSATHLLHAALRQVLGEHVQQKGSLVSASGLRFDFTQPEAITKAQLQAIENLVNLQIRRNLVIETEEMAIEAAKEKGAMALFGEKYADNVRVLTMGDFSIELCGGLHASRTGDIGLFKLVSESAIASGVRRIEALTGQGAMDFLHAQNTVLAQSAELLKADSTSLVEKIQALQDKAKKTEKELQVLQQKMALEAGVNLAKNAQEINGVKVVLERLDGIDAKALRTMVDDLKNQLGSGIVVLASATDDKVSLVVGVTKDLISKVKAGELVNLMAQLVGGKGGGRPDMAMAGGNDASQLANALQAGKEWLMKQL